MKQKGVMKMKQLKRRVSLMLVFVIACTFCLSLGTAEGSTGKSESDQGYTYTILEDNSACITKCSNGGDVIIPESLGGHSVTAIGERAFDRNQKITSVTIPEGVITIDAYAFYWCGSLTVVTLPDSLQQIGPDAFGYCTALKTINLSKKHEFFELKNGVLFNKPEKTLILYPLTKKNTSYAVPNGTLHIAQEAFAGNEYIQSVSFPKSLLTIENNAFHSCYSMKGAIKLPQSLQSVGEGAFALCDNCSSLSIPASLTEIGEKAFMGCKIKKISVDKGNQNYKVVDGVLFTADGKTLVYYPGAKKDKSYTVPEGTERLADGSFYWIQDLESLVIPEGVTVIGNYVVYVCYSLSTVQVPSTLESIGDSSLEGQTEDYVVIVPTGSFAEKWCSKKTYAYNGDYFHPLNYRVE